MVIGRVGRASAEAQRGERALSLGFFLNFTGKCSSPWLREGRPFRAGEGVLNRV